ncbi:MAG: hypothetical protein K1X51_11825 [Rhodospirillaceae bacterium]|nr:hypothetical protein [Rhodospirillaceae bacterium]
MNRWLILTGILFAHAPAFAQSQTASISVSDCQRIVSHKPNADVEYKPGVDVHGKPVVPADVGGGYGMTLPESIDIQIGVDLADRLALRDARNKGKSQEPVRKVMPFAGYAPLGTLSVRGNDLYWNDQRLQPQDEALLASACRQGFNAKGIVLPTDKPQPPGK